MNPPATRRDVILQLDIDRGPIRLAIAALRKCKR
jgi:hypothetical protein